MASNQFDIQLKFQGTSGLEDILKKLREVESLSKRIGVGGSGLNVGNFQSQISNLQSLQSQLAKVNAQQVTGTKAIADKSRQQRLLTAQIKEGNSALKQQVAAQNATTKAANATSRSMQQMARSAKKSSNTLKSAFGSFAFKFNLLANIASRVGFAITNGITNAIIGTVTVFKDFEQANQNLASVLSQATAPELERLREQAVELGTVTARTSSEVVGLQTAFSRLGFSTEEIVNLTKDTIDGSIAMNANLSETAELVGAIVKSFDNLQSSDAQVVIDQLTASTQRSALNFSKLRTAIPIVGGAANAVGLPLNELLALLGKLSDSGIDASMSATALRNIFIEAAKDGLDYKEALQTIVDSQSKLTTSNEEFGKRAAVPAAILAKNVDAVAALSEAIEGDFGVAAKAAETQLDSLTGSATLFRSAWEGMVLSFEDGNGTLNKTIRGFVDFGTATFNIIAGVKKFDKELTRSQKKMQEMAKTVINLVRFLSTMFIISKITAIMGGLVTALRSVKLGMVGTAIATGRLRVAVLLLNRALKGNLFLAISALFVTWANRANFLANSIDRVRLAAEKLRNLTADPLQAEITSTLGGIEKSEKQIQQQFLLAKRGAKELLQLEKDRNGDLVKARKVFNESIIRAEKEKNADLEKLTKNSLEKIGDLEVKIKKRFREEFELNQPGQGRFSPISKQIQDAEEANRLQAIILGKDPEDFDQNNKRLRETRLQRIEDLKAAAKLRDDLLAQLKSAKTSTLELNDATIELNESVGGTGEAAKTGLRLLEEELKLLKEGLATKFTLGQIDKQALDDQQKKIREKENEIKQLKQEIGLKREIQQFDKISVDSVEAINQANLKGRLGVIQDVKEKTFDSINDEFNLREDMLNESIDSQQSKLIEGSVAFDKLEADRTVGLEQLARDRNNAQIDLEKEKQEKLKKQAKEAEDARIDSVNKTISDTLIVTDTILEAIKQRRKSQIENLNDDLDDNRDAIKRQEALADKGLKNSLAFEEKEGAQLQAKKIKRQKNLERITRAQAFFNLFAEFAKIDPNSALAKAITQSAVAKAFAVKNEDGGILGFQDKERKGINGGIKDSIFYGDTHQSASGGVLIQAERGEGILSRKEMRSLGATNFYKMKEQLRIGDSDIFSKQNSSVLEVRQSSSSNYNFSRLESGLNEIKREIRNKPVTQTSFDKFGNVVQTTLENGMNKITKKKLRSF